MLFGLFGSAQANSTALGAGIGQGPLTTSIST